MTDTDRIFRDDASSAQVSSVAPSPDDDSAPAPEPWRRLHPSKSRSGRSRSSDDNVGKLPLALGLMTVDCGYGTTFFGCAAARVVLFHLSVRSAIDCLSKISLI